jgi:hypothetical protein
MRMGDSVVRAGESDGEPAAAGDGDSRVFSVEFRENSFFR